MTKTKSDTVPIDAVPISEPSQQSLGRTLLECPFFDPFFDLRGADAVEVHEHRAFLPASLGHPRGRGDPHGNRGHRAAERDGAHGGAFYASRSGRAGESLGRLPPAPAGRPTAE